MGSTHKDVIVVGGGVIGLAIAYRLATRGATVLLVERGAIGREASWAGAGILEFGSLTRSDSLALLRRASVRRYEPWINELRRRTNTDPQYMRCGGLDIILDDNQAASANREAGEATRAGHKEVRLLSATELQRLEPKLARDIRGALLREDTAQVRNPRLLSTLIAACAALGVELRENCPIVDLHVQHERIAGVQSVEERYYADNVVVAAGAWSAQIPTMRELLRLTPVRGQIVLLESVEPPTRRVVMCGKRYLVPRSDGLILVGSTEEPNAGFDTRPTVAGARRLLDFVARVAPSLSSAPIARIWSGLRPAAPDGRPYIGPVASIGGLYVATGHFRSGLTLAPITADVITELIKGDTVECDLTAFVPGRPFQSDSAAQEDAPQDEDRQS